MKAQRTAEEVARKVEAVRADVQARGWRHEARPEIAGRLIEARDYAARLGEQAPAATRTHLAEAAHLYVHHANGATDAVARCLTSALEHLALTAEIRSEPVARHSGSANEIISFADDAAKPGVPREAGA